MDARYAFRRGNRLIARAAQDAPDEAVGFICECREESCLVAIFLTPREHGRLTGAERFVVVPGHESLDVEDVVEEGAGYTVVLDQSGVDCKASASGLR
jgi:hypothetical protein